MAASSFHLPKLGFKLFRDQDRDLEFESLIISKKYQDALVFLEKNPLKNEEISVIVSNLSTALLYGLRSYFSANWCDFVINTLENKKYGNKIFQAVVDLMPNLSVTNPDTAADLLIRIISRGNQNEQEALFNRANYLLFPSSRDGLGPYIIDFLKSNPNNVLFETFIKIAVNKSNVLFLKELRQLNGELFEKIINTMGDKVISRCKILLELNDHAARLMTERMNQFTCGFGKVDYEGGLITCAQIAARKKDYLFNPVVLKSTREFEEFLKTLKTMPIPLRQRFIIQDIHWLSGDITVDANGQVKILIIDSVGSLETHDEARQAITCFSKIFPDQTIYFTIDPRQKGLGCSIFAIDDVRHLFTVERYLEEKYQKTGLFGYLSDNSKSPEVKNDTTAIKISNLPLPMMRAMQSRSLLDVVIPGKSKTEQETPVNKKKQTALVSAKLHFFAGEEKIEKNRRLEYTLGKFANYNLAFLLAHLDEKNLQAQLEPFTLEGFKARAANKQSQSKGVTNLLYDTEESVNPLLPPKQQRHR